MIQRLPDLEHDVGVEPSAPGVPAVFDSVDSWLGVFTRLLGLPAEKSRSIRDELDAHLRERVRDLVLAGSGEHEAMRQAIGELGDAATLARRFQKVERSPRRRNMMYAALIGISAVSITTAGIMITAPNAGSRATVFESTPLVQDQSARLDETEIAVAFNEALLQEVLGYFGEMVESDVLVHWGSLADAGIDADSPVNLVLNQDRPVSRVLQLLGEQLDSDSGGFGTFDWRMSDDLLEFALAEHFDRRETVMAAFDLSDVFRRIQENPLINDDPVDLVTTLIHEYVEADSWMVNGGEVAQLTVIGSKMFLKAPRRYHEPIQWILDQLQTGEIDALIGADAGDDRQTAVNWTSPHLDQWGHPAALPVMVDPARCTDCHAGQL